MPLDLTASFHPTGDQPRAIDQLTGWVRAGYPHATLLGTTGSGKTFTMAGVIANTQRPTLVISPNKTLAAQLYSEFKEFFPSAAVHYFVSYYDYYQPEAYVPSSDTYIEKEAMVNEEIDRLRHAATQSLLTRQDVIIVASVSCIYGLGSPEEYGNVTITLRQGTRVDRRDLIRQLVDLQFQRNDLDLSRGTFRVKGDTVEIYPKASDKDWIRIECGGDHVERITARDIGGTIGSLDKVTIFPATHYVASPVRFHRVLSDIRGELEERLTVLRGQDKLVEAQRLSQRTTYDLQMLEETGYVHGIENYSRYFDGREPGKPPFTLVDFYNYAYTTTDRTTRITTDTGATPRTCEDSDTESVRSVRKRSVVDPGWLCFIDESHITIPQIRGMYAGDRSRKQTLIEYGFRLPSCLDNRPLQFAEFTKRVPQTVYVSATPEEYELRMSNDEFRMTNGRTERRSLVAEQLIRPTGLLDPEVEVRPSEGQMPDLIREIEQRVRKHQRVLVTVLTKRMAEDLAEYLQERKIKAFYIHADVETFERVEILDDLRRGRYDVLVGINLLREGLDLPEVSLVAILDADKEGFLRSHITLIQTMGRAARHAEGRVIMYADRMTESMRLAIAEVNRRREIQSIYNREHNITPTSIVKEIRGPIVGPSAVGRDRTKRSKRRREKE
ncbi:excinuclease ABC subunit UvrB [Candidatus Uhrbacteria bacterium]|nr:excinuclease ABC subunit UvrB [Candidatus Uhrbacteria bacterium]